MNDDSATDGNPAQPNSLPFPADGAKADTPVLEAARHIFSDQFDVMRRNRELALTGSEPEYLHDFRVAARRFRAGLSLFKPLLGDTSAEGCNRHLAELRRQLGDIRDAHVWLLFLEELAQKRPFNDSADFQTYLQNCREADDHATDALHAVLNSGLCMLVTDMMVHLLEAELPRLSDAHADECFGPFAAARLEKRLRRLLKSEARVKHMSDEEIHTLRKACRKARYFAEFAAPAMGKPVDQLAKRLKQVTTTLGDIHDMDVRLQALASGQTRMPAIILRAIHTHRRRAVHAFGKAWHDLTAGKPHKEAMKVLREAETSSVAETR